MYAHHFLDKNLGAVNTVILICSSLTMAWAVRAAQLGQRKILQLMLVLTLVFACGFLGIKYVEYGHKWKHGLLWASQYQPDDYALALAEGGGHAEKHHDAEHAADGSADEAPAVAEESDSTEDSAAGDGVVAAANSAEPEAARATEERSNFAPAALGPGGLATESDRAAAEAEAEALDVDPKDARTFFSIYFMMTGLHGLHVVLGMAAMVWLLFRAARGFYDGGHATQVDTIGLYWHLVDLIWIYLFLLLYLIH
jgi:cytochrome c oxidase subunit 3